MGGVNTYDPLINSNVQSVSLFRYDITSIAGGSTINSAILHIYGGGSNIQAVAIFIYPITNASWSEAVTWNTQPTHSTPIGKLNVFRKSIGTLSTNLYDNGNQWQTYDLTQYVASQFGLGLKAEIMLYPDSGYSFVTSFSSEKTANKSYITVTSTL